MCPMYRIYLDSQHKKMQHFLKSMLPSIFLSFNIMRTRGVGATPALAQAQRVAAPGGGVLVVSEAWRGTGRGRGVARPLRDFPQFMGQRGLALGDGPWGPGGLHVRQFTFTWRGDS